MIKENQKVFNYVNIITDGLAIVFAMALSYVLRFYVLNGEAGHAGIGYYIWSSLGLAPFFLFIYGLSGLYQSFRSRRFMDELNLIIRSNFIGTILTVAAFFIIKNINISRLTLLIFFFLSTAAVGTKRFVLRRGLRTYRSRGYNLKHVLLIGSGKNAEQYYNAVSGDRSFGFNVVGCVTDGNAPEGLRILGGFNDLPSLIKGSDFDEVVAALDIGEADQIGNIISACEKNGTKLSLIPFYADYLPSHPYIDEVGGVSLINLRRIPLDNVANAFSKRLVDIIGSSVMLILLLPLMIFAAAGTVLSSPGPVIFSQARTGKDKKIFTIYKFRSMRINAKQDTGWSTDDDNRRTRFGAFIRKFSIDELPQLFNVLKGDMSLVGPRPEVPHYVEQFREAIPLYMIKHQVRPGITGWAQVNGLRGDTSIEERVKYDIFYIENWSLIFDLRILLMTVFKGLFINSEKLN